MNGRSVELKVEHLSKYYPAGKHKVLKAVDDVSFELYKGETLGIVGESGCGKTTCGKTCIGMLKKTSGNVLYQGKNVHQMSKKREICIYKKSSDDFSRSICKFKSTNDCWGNYS